MLSQVPKSEGPGAPTHLWLVGHGTRLKTNDGMKGTRINFLREVQDSDEARKALVEMVRAAEPKARSRLNLFGRALDRGGYSVPIDHDMDKLRMRLRR